MFGRAGLLAVFAVEEVDVDGLADEVAEIFFTEFVEARTEEDVVVNVVNADGESAEANFGGVRLELHPGRMGIGDGGAQFDHVAAGCGRAEFLA